MCVRETYFSSMRMRSSNIREFPGHFSDRILSPMITFPGGGGRNGYGDKMRNGTDMGIKCGMDMGI